MKFRTVSIVSAIVLFSLLFIASAPGDSSANRQQTSAAKPDSLAKPHKTLLFFMNPNGGPCQMQDGILSSLKDSLVNRVDVHYYKTTVPADRQAFSAYGIRALPSLILIDSKGKEVHRFTPGIQDDKTILSALK